MANSTSHILPYPIRNARYSLGMPFRTTAGTPTDPTLPDTEISTDGGASFIDCAEEITTGGGNGFGYLTLTGSEMNNPLLMIAGKSSNCVESPAILHPRNLALIGSGTLSAGSAGGGTLGTLLAYDVTNCFIRTTGGTGGGGAGGLNNQARRILTYNTTTGAFTVSNWETQPDNTTTYDVLLPDGVTLGTLRAVNPVTPGNKIALSTTGDVSLGAILGTALTETAGLIAAAFSKFFNKATPTGTVNSLPDFVPGTAGGLHINGVNAGTTTFGALTITGAMTMAGLTTGAISSTTITASGAVSLGATTIAGLTTGALACTTVTVSGAVALQSSLTVTGATVLTGAVTATNAANDIQVDVVKWLGVAPGAIATTTDIATGVWTDTTAGDFTVANSIGRSLAPATLGTAPGASGGHQINGTNNGAITYSGGITIMQGFDITGGVDWAGGVVFHNSVGTAFTCQSQGGNGHGIYALGNGSGDGFEGNGGINGRGTHLAGGTGSLEGLFVESQKSGYAGFRALSAGGVNDIIGTMLGPIGISSNIKRGQALPHFGFKMFNSATGKEQPGANITATVSIDGGPYTAGTLTNILEVVGGIGNYTIDFGSGDMLGTEIMLRAVAPGCDATDERIVTQP